MFVCLFVCRLAGRLGPPVWQEGDEPGEQLQPQREERARVREERGREGRREEVGRERQGVREVRGRAVGWRGVGEGEERRTRRDSEGEDQEIEEESKVS